MQSVTKVIDACAALMGGMNAYERLQVLTVLAARDGYKLVPDSDPPPPPPPKPGPRHFPILGGHPAAQPSRPEYERPKAAGEIVADDIPLPGRHPIYPKRLGTVELTDERPKAEGAK